MRHSNTRFGAYLYSAGTQQENLLETIDYEQCDLFYFAGYRGNLLQPRLTQLKSMERIWEKIKMNGPGKRKLGQGRNYGID